MLQHKHGRLPAANSAADADECVALAREVNETLQRFAALTPGAKQRVIAIDNLDEAVVR